MSSTADSPLLVVRNATCVIPTSHGDVAALTEVDLTLRAGEILGLVGESGSGKSTLAKMIVGASARGARTSGAIELEGTDLESLPPEKARGIRGRRIGIVFQDPMMALNPVVPVGRQITEGPRFMLGMSKNDARDLAIDLLGQVGIPEPQKRLKQFPHQFSGGMRQRLTIAMALSCSPDILIADEATTALDVTVQRQILDLLARLAAERSLSMIMVSHDLSVIAGRTHSTAVMYAGRIVEAGSTPEVFSRPRHPYTEALLEAIPRIDAPSHGRLKTIPGTPPNLMNLPRGCSFAPRCVRSTAECVEVEPATTWEADHRYRCFHPVASVEREAS